MASQALYRKWRSQDFGEIIGQTHVTHTLINALRLGRIGHAYLFTGPRGTGKTSTARLLAKAVNCLQADVAQRPCNQCSLCIAITEGRLLDLIEIDAASNTGVDDIRDLRDKVSFRPNEARIKFYIIDEVHMLSNSAFNALLKTLEEPPTHVIFVLATTEPEKIPATITSRCQRFDFKRISIEDVANHLAFILTQEGLSADRDALEYIARQGGGSMRDAISLLDQLTAYGQEKITLARVKEILGVVSSQTVLEVVEALITRDIPTGLDLINNVVGEGSDPRQFGREIVEYLRMVMLVKHGGQGMLIDLPADIATTLKMQATQADKSLLLQATKLFNQSLLDLKSGLLTIPHLPLELAFIEAVTAVSHTDAPMQRDSTPLPPSSSKPNMASQPPQPHTPQTQPASKPVPKNRLDINIVKQSFGKVVHIIEGKNKFMAEVLRNNAIIHKVDQNQVYLAVDTSYKGRFEKPIPKAALAEAFGQILKQAVEIAFISKESLSKQTNIGEEPETLVEAARKLASQPQSY